MGWGSGEEGGSFQRSKRTDNHRQESGTAEPINKTRFLGLFSFFLLFFALFLLSGQKMFNSSALGANYTAEKNDPR